DRTTLGQLIVEELRDQPAVYLSAHTHQGWWRVHRLPHDRALLELNVGSLADWPIAYRLLTFDYLPSERRLRIVARLQPTAPDASAYGAETARNTASKLRQAWLSQVCGSESDAAWVLRTQGDIVSAHKSGMRRPWDMGPVFLWFLRPRYRNPKL